MTGLLINIHSWCRWTQDADVDVAVDHKAVVQIMKSKHPSTTDRVRLLIRKLSPPPFTLYYIKGKDLTLADFLSCICSDKSDPNEVLPISFVDLNLQEKFSEQLNVVMRSHMKQDGMSLPAIHGVDKAMDLHKKPEHQPQIAKPLTAPHILPGVVQFTPAPAPKPWGTAPKIKSQAVPPAPLPPKPAPPMHVTHPPPFQMTAPARPSQNQVIAWKLIDHSIKTLQKSQTNMKFAPVLPLEAPLVPQFDILINAIPAPAYAQQVPVATLPPAPGKDASAGPQPMKAAIMQKMLTPSPVPETKQGHYHTSPAEPAGDQVYYSPATLQTNPRMQTPCLPMDPNVDLGIPLHQFKDLVDLVIHAPNKTDTDPAVPLSKFTDVRKLHAHEIPQQKNLDKLFKLLETKILRQVHLPTSFRDLHGAYLHSPHFRDIYLYLLQNKAPHNQCKRFRVISQSTDYMLLDNLLFKIVKDRITKEYKPLLCIPTSKIEMLLQYFHSSIMGGHMGITKTYMTLSQRCFCPNLAHHIRAYIISCHICQTVKISSQIKRPFQKQININVPALCKISMDIKHMPLDESSNVSFILVMLCDVSNFLVVAPLRATQTKLVCDAINKHFIRNFSPLTHLTCDLDPAFMSSLAQAFFQHYGIQLITVSPTNHKSLLAEHGIKSLAEILKCHLSGLGPNWSKYLDFAMLAYNSYNTPNLDGLSPFELVFG